MATGAAVGSSTGANKYRQAKSVFRRGRFSVIISWRKLTASTPVFRSTKLRKDVPVASFLHEMVHTSGLCGHDAKNRTSGISFHTVVGEHHALAPEHFTRAIRGAFSCTARTTVSVFFFPRTLHFYFLRSLGSKVALHVQLRGHDSSTR